MVDKIKTSIPLLLCIVVLGETILLYNQYHVIADLKEEISSNIILLEEKTQEINDSKKDLQYANEKLTERGERVLTIEHKISEYNAIFNNFFFTSDVVYTPFPELDPLLIDTLKRHFTALYYGDKEAYAETLIENEPSFWMLNLERLNQKAYYCAVNVINANYNVDNGEHYRMHVPVLICYQEAEGGEVNYKAYYCGIAKKDGSYYIYDYD